MTESGFAGDTIKGDSRSKVDSSALVHSFPLDESLSPVQINTCAPAMIVS